MASGLGGGWLAVPAAGVAALLVSRSAGKGCGPRPSFIRDFASGNPVTGKP